MGFDGTTGAILSNYSEVLKTYYLPGIQEYLNNDNVLSHVIDTNEEDVVGKNATLNCHYGRSSGTGARPDGGALPEGDHQKFKTCIVPTQRQYGRIYITGQTLKATARADGAYAEVLDTEIVGIVEDLKKEVNRQYWGCGYGILARWRSTVGATSYTLQKKYRGNSIGGDGFGSTFGAKYFEENASGVPCVNSAFSSGYDVTVDDTNIDVSAIAESTDYDTVTVTDPDVTEAVGTLYVRPGNARTITSASAAGHMRLEMMGLRGIVTDTDVDDIALFDDTADEVGAKVNDPLQGLAVGTYAWFKAQVDSHASGRYAGQRAISFDLMQRMFDKIEIKAGKDVGPSIIMTAHAVRREVLELHRIERRAVNTLHLSGGFTGIDYNGVPIVVDADAIDGEMYFLTLADLAVYRMSDYEWMDKDGALLSRISGYDAYEAVLFRYAELGCRNRANQGVITDLAYTK